MSLQKKAVSGVLWTSIEAWGGQLISFAVFSLLARLLLPDAFGLVALAGVVLAFLQTFVDQGLANAIVQRKDLAEEHLDSAFWANLAAALVLTGVSVALAGPIAALAREPLLEPVLRWISLAFILTALSGVQSALFKRELRFKPQAVRRLIGIVIGGLTGVAMALSGFGVWSLVGQQLANSLVNVFLLWQLSTWRPRWRFSFPHFRELFAYGASIMGLNVIDFFRQRFASLLIGVYLDATALGFFTVAGRLIQLLTNSLTGVSGRVALPAFSRLQDQPERLRHALCRVTRLSALLAFPAFAGLAATAPTLVPLVFGGQWQPSIPLLQILCIGGMVQAFAHFTSSTLLALGASGVHLRQTVISSAGAVLAFFIGLRWGLFGVAASQVAAAVLFIPLPLVSLKKLIGLKYRSYAAQLIVPAAGAILVFVAARAVSQLVPESFQAWSLLALQATAGILVYTFLLLAFERHALREAHAILRQLLPKRPAPLDALSPEKAL